MNKRQRKKAAPWDVTRIYLGRKLTRADYLDIREAQKRNLSMLMHPEKWIWKFMAPAEVHEKPDGSIEYTHIILLHPPDAYRRPE